jgi:hypothetical protein
VRLSEKLKLSSTSGDWDVSLVNGESCCHGAAYVLDTILFTIRLKRRSMLRSLPFVDSVPKGVSKLQGATVYVVRLSKDGARRMARPCGSCMTELKQKGVKDVVYTTDGGWERERLSI